jgi:hypothetical protein
LVISDAEHIGFYATVREEVMEIEYQKNWMSRNRVWNQANCRIEAGWTKPQPWLWVINIGFPLSVTTMGTMEGGAEGLR